MPFTGAQNSFMELLCPKLRLNLKYRVTQKVAWHCWLNLIDTVLTCTFIDCFRCSQCFVWIGTLCKLPITLAHIVWQSCLLLSLFNIGCQVTFVPARILSVARFRNSVSFLLQVSVLVHVTCLGATSIIPAATKSHFGATSKAEHIILKKYGPSFRIFLSSIYVRYLYLFWQCLTQ